MKEIFNIKNTTSDENVIAILDDERNYDYFTNSIGGVGKLCDVIINPSSFAEALKKTKILWTLTPKELILQSFDNYLIICS